MTSSASRGGARDQVSHLGLSSTGVAGGGKGMVFLDHEEFEGAEVWNVYHVTVVKASIYALAVGQCDVLGFSNAILRSCRIF